VKEQVDAIRQAVAQAQSRIITQEDLEKFKRDFTSKLGAIAQLLDQLKGLTVDEKRHYGPLINTLKAEAEDFVRSFYEQLELNKQVQRPADLTLDATPVAAGSRHPVSQVERQIISIFERLGYTIADGPEIEDDFHNFTALNFAANHPARDMQDTFFLTEDKNWLLRTHTTSVQVRYLEHHQPPVRILMPGRVYRNEVVTARSHCYFHQIDGVVVDEGVSFQDLKAHLLFFVQQLFGSEARIRFRASYFPFTEISAEVDVSCFICHGKGCNVCKHTGWVEILGCGMIHPNVLKACGIDADRYSGFAFGMGLERTTMMLHGIPDLRLFSQNDLRFLEQFGQLNT
jgi:phenylalanyl-tRNA synthetase alpha chain